eukprot:scaffold5.g935.t1
MRTAFGHSWRDDYAWLEQGGPDVEAALEAEAAFFRAWRQRHAPLERSLCRAMLRALPAEQCSTPERVGEHEYYIRQTPERPLPCYLRYRMGGQGGGQGGRQDEKVVLDLNELAAVHGESISLGQLKLSRCGTRVAFTLDEGTGDECFSGFVRDLSTGATWQHSAMGAVVSLEWAADSDTLLFTTPNQLGRPWAVHTCSAGAPPAAAPAGAARRRGSVLSLAGAWAARGAGGSSAFGSSARVLYEEPDERFFVDLGRTKDWNWLTINANAKLSSEEREPGLEYFVESSEGQLYLLSNTGSARGEVPAGGPLGRPHWVQVLPEREGIAIEDMDLFQDALVLYARRWGRPAVTVLPLRGGLPLGSAAPAAPAGPEVAEREAVPEPAAAPANKPGAAATGAGCDAAAGGQAAQGSGAAAVPLLLLELPLPDWAFWVQPGANADYASPTLRLTLSSPIHPDTATDWDLATALPLPEPAVGSEQQPRMAAAVAAGRQLGDYVCEQLWAPAADGVRVPITVARSAAVPLDGTAPCLLIAYGAYGHCLPTDFEPSRLPLLARGWVLALAHVRGGGELGRAWHAAGRAALKGNSGADLEACLDHLVASGAALLEVPFVDLLTCMASPELPLTQHEHDEWGDPSDPETFRRLAATCPYQRRLPAGPLPALFVTCSQTDMRVPFWGPLKYAAKLRAAQAAGGGRPMLVAADAHGGHFAPEREHFRLKAQEYAFLVSQLEAQGGRRGGAP